MRCVGLEWMGERCLLTEIALQTALTLGLARSMRCSSQSGAVTPIHRAQARVVASPNCRVAIRWVQ